MIPKHVRSGLSRYMITVKGLGAGLGYGGLGTKSCGQGDVRNGGLGGGGISKSFGDGAGQSDGRGTQSGWGISYERG